MGQHFILGALCYLFQNDHVLMLQRTNPPHQGKWTAPGGKLELGESPDEAVRREIWEETQLTIDQPHLRGIATVTDLAYPFYWQLFIYTAAQFSGEIPTELTAEGYLAWLPLNALSDYEMPHADQIYLPFLLDSFSGVFRVKVIYNTPSVVISQSIHTNT